MADIIISSSDSLSGSVLNSDLIPVIRSGTSILAQPYSQFASQLRAGLALQTSLDAHEGDQDAHWTAAQMISAFDSEIGNSDWQVAALTQSEILALIADPAEQGNSSAWGVAKIPDLPASKITSGQFGTARIPNLAAAKITSGTLDAARIPGLAASKITSGQFALARIPDLPASQITSGTLADARIPGLAASKITSGTLAVARIPNSIARDTEVEAAVDDVGLSISGTTLTLERDGSGSDSVNVPTGGGAVSDGVINSMALSINAGHELVATAGRSVGANVASAGLALTAASIPDLDADKIATGTLHAGRIPGLDAAKIDSGTLADARIPNLPAGKITSGAFDAARIPNLPASRITSGEFAVARIPDLPASQISSGTLADARIPGLAASKITSGTFDAARIPSSVARDTEVAAAVDDVGISIAGTVLTLHRDGSGGDSVTVPSSGGGGGGTNDGVTNSLALSLNASHELVATAGRSIGADVVSAGLALTEAAIPASIARDTEVTAAVDNVGISFSDPTLTLLRDGSGADTAALNGLIILPDSSGDLPDPDTRAGRVAVSGNQVLEAIDHGDHTKVVEFDEYSPTRTEPPNRSSNENHYVGSFADPPHSTIDNYDVNDIAWDRGGQVWLIKAAASDTRWSSYSGPLGWHHGHIYSTEAVAARHISAAAEVGNVVIYGTGAAQKPYVVTDFTAATGPDWRWDPLGLTSADVLSVIAGQFSDDDPEPLGTAAPGTALTLTHPDHVHSDDSVVLAQARADAAFADALDAQNDATQALSDAADKIARADITAGDNITLTNVGANGLQIAASVSGGGGGDVTTAELNSAISTHNTSATAHNDIRSDLSDVEDRLDALDPLEIEAYDSSATYARGSANSIVTHSNGLFIYISATERSSGHDPDTQPGYWFELSEGVAYEVISTGSHRIAARTLVVNGDNDNVYLCTTTQTTPRDLDYIHAQSESAGGAFILLNGSGSGGTTVTANPSGTDGDDLERIAIAGTNYNIPAAATGPLAPDYESDATYSLGGSNSLVTFQDQIYFYSSTVSRNSNHSPETHPDYWIDISTVSNWVSLNETDEIRIPGGTFVILPDDSSVYLSRDDVDATALRDAAYIRSHAAAGEQFILVSGGAGGNDGEGAVTLTPLTEAEHNYAFTNSSGLQSSQTRRLYDSDISFPTDLDDDELIYLDVDTTNGNVRIPLTVDFIEDLTAVTPITWALNLNGTLVDLAGDDANAKFFPLGQNRGFFLGISNETPLRLQWGMSHTSITMTMQLTRVTAGSGKPGGEASDGSISGLQTDQFVVTDIDVPEGTWGYVNVGDVGDQRAGPWHRFLLADLTGRTDVAAGTAPSDANALIFPIDDQGVFYLGQTAGDKVAVAWNQSDRTPGNLRVRSN